MQPLKFREWKSNFHLTLHNGCDININISPDKNVLFRFYNNIMYSWYITERNDILIVSCSDELMNMIILGVKVLISCPHVFGFFHWVSRLNFIDRRRIFITWQLPKIVHNAVTPGDVCIYHHHLAHVMTCHILRAVPLPNSMLLHQERI